MKKLLKTGRKDTYPAWQEGHLPSMAERYIPSMAERYIPSMVGGHIPSMVGGLHTHHGRYPATYPPW